MKELSFGNSLKQFASQAGVKKSPVTVTKRRRQPSVEDDSWKETISSSVKSFRQPELLTKSKSDSPQTVESEPVDAKPKAVKARKRRKYAPPEVYSHLKPLSPLLRPGLRCVFIGFNPGTTTALKGHYYAHHSNGFWKFMSSSGCVSRKVTYLDDQSMPDEFGIGFTDLVERPTTGISELSTEEMESGAISLEERIRTNAPGMVCFIGKGIWETVYRVRMGKRLKDFEWGYQRNYGFVFADCPNVFVLPSTSGLVAGVSKSEKERLWNQVSKFLNKTFPLNGPDTDSGSDKADARHGADVDTT